MNQSLSKQERHHLARLAVEVVEAEPADRSALIARYTEGRPDLREILQRLIQLDLDIENDPLADLAEAFREALRDTEAHDPHDHSGEIIDNYTLVRRLGSGAYGSVYLAEQAAPVQRSVALKLLHPGVGSPRILRRFDLERRVLAALDHPGIARLLDAGAAPDGRPYFVMDLVHGPNLRTYCRENNLSIPQCISLLAGACDAIQHAHSRGVIHRDLKPGNILVHTVDDKPRPVVIDFGVARLIDPDPALSFTTTIEAVGTRRYMSPEQRNAGVVDARSDVYALGITLRDIIPTPNSSAELAPLPSTTDPIRATADDPTNTHIPRQVRWIIEKCCAPAPADRYQTVSELGADLRRYLANEPLLASPPGFLYRTRLAATRHPWTTALIIFALAAVVAFAVHAVIANARLERELTAQRDMITSTIDEILDEVWVFRGSEHAREKLVRGLLQRTDELLSRRPDDIAILETKARLLRALGFIYLDLSNPQAMQLVCLEAKDIYDRIAPHRSDDVEFIRAHAEAVVRVGNSYNQLQNKPPDQFTKYYDEALRMQLGALERFPNHVGLRDDIYWSYTRIADNIPARRTYELVARKLDHAGNLFDDSPDRILSKFALQDAHLRYAVYLRDSEDPDHIRTAAEHFDHAIRLARELITEHPGQAGFVYAHGSALWSSIIFHAAQKNIDLVRQLCRELESSLTQVLSDHSHRYDTQQYATYALRELALAYHSLGLQQKAIDTALRLRDFALDTSMHRTTHSQRVANRALAELIKAGLLPDPLNTDD